MKRPARQLWLSLALTLAVVACGEQGSPTELDSSALASSVATQASSVTTQASSVATNTISLESVEVEPTMTLSVYGSCDTNDIAFLSAALTIEVPGRARGALRGAKYADVEVDFQKGSSSPNTLSFPLRDLWVDNVLSLGSAIVGSGTEFRVLEVRLTLYNGPGKRQAGEATVPEENILNNPYTFNCP